MRRISLKYARPGMVLGYPVFDPYGVKLLDTNVKLDEHNLKMLIKMKVNEIFIQDSRVYDIISVPLIPPEIEGRASAVLRQLMIETRISGRLTLEGVRNVGSVVEAMVNHIHFSTIGEPSVAGIMSREDFIYIQPVKAAILSLIVAHKLKWDRSQLTSLGMAAMLKDIGYAELPEEVLRKPDELTKEEVAKLREHPALGQRLLRQFNGKDTNIATAIMQHHERWNGSGYPLGLRGARISPLAQMLAIADSYTELISVSPWRTRVYMPHEAIEFIMAYSGEYFNPEMVDAFVKQIPCYPAGLTVELNTKEVGIVSDSKRGFIGRPVVRICYHPKEGILQQPYDLDLSKPDFQSKFIVKILDYF